MSIKNGDMPAIPQSVAIGPSGDVEYSERAGGGGLTKLETFAMNAPAMPKWFEGYFVSNPEINKGIDYRIYSNITGGSGNITLEGKVTVFMAWPVYYADALLSQLEKE